MGRIFQIPLLGKDNAVKSARINYSIATMMNKVYLYGGLNDQNEGLSTMEMFDATTYKMSEVAYRLEARVAGRQGHAAIALDKFNMVVIGGTGEAGFIDPTPLKPEELVCSFDLEATTWHPKSARLPNGSDPIPWNLVYVSLFKIDSQNIGVLWYDKAPAIGSDIEESKESQSLQRFLRVSTYNNYTNSWRTIRLVSKIPMA